MEQQRPSRLSRFAVAGLMLYFFALGAGYFYLTFKNLDHSVVVLGPEPVLPGQRANFRLIAYDEKSGLPTPITGVTLLSGNQPAEIQPQLDLTDRVAHVSLQLPRSASGPTWPLKLRVQFASGAMDVGLSVLIMQQQPEERGLELPEGKSDRQTTPPREKGWPYRVTLLPEFGRLHGNHKNRLLIRVTDQQGKPVSIPLTVRLQEKKKALFSLRTGALGLTSFRFLSLAPMYTVRITLRPKESSQHYEAVRYVNPTGQAFTVDQSQLYIGPGSKPIRFTAQALNRSPYRYCDHYWRGLWLNSKRLKKRRARCALGPFRPGLHSVLFSDHYALPGSGWVRRLLLVSDKKLIGALRQLASALKKRSIDVDYTTWLQQKLQPIQLSDPGQSDLLLRYLLSRVPRKARTPKRLLDTRTSDQRELDRQRSSGRRWLLRLMIISCGIMLLVLIIVLVLVYTRTRKRLLELAADGTLDSEDDPFDSSDELLPIRPANPWIPVILLTVVTLACAAILALFWQL